MFDTRFVIFMCVVSKRVTLNLGCSCFRHLKTTCAFRVPVITTTLLNWFRHDIFLYFSIHMIYNTTLCIRRRSVTSSHSHDRFSLREQRFCTLLFSGSIGFFCLSKPKNTKVPKSLNYWSNFKVWCKLIWFGQNLFDTRLTNLIKHCEY